MRSTVKVSAKNQIVIPKDAREALAIRPGDRLLVEVQGRQINLRPVPKSYAEALRGLHKELWEGIDSEEYLAEERLCWDE